MLQRFFLIQSCGLKKILKGNQCLEVVQSADVWVAVLLEQLLGKLVVPNPEGIGDLRLVLLLPRRFGGIRIGRSLCCGGTPLSLASLDSSPFRGAYKEALWH